MKIAPPIAVAVGGFLGATSRWLLITENPWSTLAVNTLGCALLGLLSTRQQQLPPSLYAGLSTGFCGAFTTLSLLAALFWQHQQSSNLWALTYLVITLTCGLVSYGLIHKLTPKPPAP